MVGSWQYFKDDSVDVDVFETGEMRSKEGLHQSNLIKRISDVGSRSHSHNRKSPFHCLVGNKENFARDLFFNQLTVQLLKK